MNKTSKTILYVVGAIACLLGVLYITRVESNWDYPITSTEIDSTEIDSVQIDTNVIR